MVQFRIIRNQEVGHLNNWIVVSERNWIAVTTQFFWNKDFLTLFKLKNELFLDKFDSDKRAFNEKYIN